MNTVHALLCTVMSLGKQGRYYRIRKFKHVFKLLNRGIFVKI
jgi:hypothetical protein